MKNKTMDKSPKTMSSLEIADLSGKTHDNVLKAIRSMETAWVKVAGVKFNETSYIDQWNKNSLCLS